MSGFEQWVYTPANVRELDRIAIEEQGIPGYELMRRAGQFAFDVMREHYPAARRWQIFCGSGNNAGDGYVIGRLAIENGLAAAVVTVAEPARLTGDAARAYQAYAAAGGMVYPFGDQRRSAGAADLIVDALLGTGLERPLAAAYADAVAAINGAALPVAAVDIPSGLNGSSGEVMGSAVRADLCVTFVGMKQGLFLGAGPDHCGKIFFHDLGIAPIPPDRVAPALQCAGPALRGELLPRRSRTAHKGRFGHVLVIGGNHGMGGAVRLAGAAALRSGAGLVSLATRPANVPAVIAGCPELMCRGVDAAEDIDDLLARASVIAIGPGLGQDQWAHAMLVRAISAQLPLVVDADALNLLAADPRRREDWVLTPHPGEAARLLGIDAAKVQADRGAALRELQQRYGGTVLLKGAGTLVSAGGALPWLIRAGNPGMASAGMGDVLTGITAAVLAQCPDAEPAARVALAAWLHAAAGDRAAQAGERGLLASDVIAELRACLN